MSSLGIALSLAVFFVAVWDASVERKQPFKIVIASALFLWVATNATVLLHRNSLWKAAGVANRTVIEQLSNYTHTLSPDQEIWLIALPDRFGEAFVFRNTFPAAGVLVGYPQAIQPILDVEVVSFAVSKIGELESNPQVVTLLFQDGYLTPVNLSEFFAAH